MGVDEKRYNTKDWIDEVMMSKPDTVEPMPTLEKVRKVEPPQLMYTQVAVRYAILAATAAERERCASEIERILKEWVQSPSKIKACPHIASEGAVFFGLWCSMCLATAIREGK